jgi:hypothetical protein
MAMRRIISSILFDRYPTQILLIEFLSNGVLNARIIRLILIPQTIDVEDVIP